MLPTLFKPLGFLESFLSTSSSLAQLPVGLPFHLCPAGELWKLGRCVSLCWSWAGKHLPLILVKLQPKSPGCWPQLHGIQRGQGHLLRVDCAQ